MFKFLRIFLFLALLPALGVPLVSAQEVTQPNDSGNNDYLSYPNPIKFAFYSNSIFGSGTWLNKKFSFRLTSSEETPVTVEWNGTPFEYLVTSAGTEISSPEGGLLKDAVQVYVQEPDKITKIDFSNSVKYGWASNYGLSIGADLVSLEEVNGAESPLIQLSVVNGTLANCKRIDLHKTELNSFKYNGTALEYLDLSACGLGDNRLDLTQCSESLKYLNLSGNKLGKATSAQLGTFANIEHLDISKNGIEQLILTQLGDLSNLKYLDVSNQGGHKLKYVRWPESLSNINTLKCEGNRLYFNMLPLPQNLPAGAVYSYGDQAWCNDQGYQTLTKDNIANTLALSTSFYTYDGISTHAQWQVDDQDIDFNQKISYTSMTFGFPESHENMYCLLTHDKFPGLTITAGPESIGVERVNIAQIIVQGQNRSEGSFTFRVKTDGKDNEIVLYNPPANQLVCGGACTGETSVFTGEVTDQTNILFLFSTNPAGIVSLDLSRPESAGETTGAFFNPNVMVIGPGTLLPNLEDFICDGHSDLFYLSLMSSNQLSVPSIKRISANNTAVTDVKNFIYVGAECPSLESLSLSGNGINSESSLNLSPFSNLRELNVSDNALPGLDVSAIGALTKLNCANNRISSLRLPLGNGSPYALDCSGNKLHFLTLPAPALVPGTYAYDPQDNVDLTFSDGCIDVSEVTDDAGHIAVFEGSEGDTQLHPGADYMVMQRGASIRIRFVHDHESVRVRFGHTGFADDFYIWSNPVRDIKGLPDAGAAVIFATQQDSHLPLEVEASVTGSPDFYSFQVDWGNGEIAIPMPHRADNGVKNDSPNFYGTPSGSVKVYDPETQLSSINISEREICSLTVTGASKISSINASGNVLMYADLALSVATDINLSRNLLDAVDINTGAEISELDLSYNRLHFGTLPLPAANIKKYDYTNQAKVPLQSSGYTVTATKYMPTLNGTPTTARWFEADGTEIPSTEYEQTADGVFTFKDAHSDMYCEMYNDLFPGSTITSMPVSLFDSSLDGYELAFTMTFAPSEIGKEFQLSASFDGKAVIDRGDGVITSLVRSHDLYVEHGDNSVIISGENDTDPVVVKVFATMPDKVRTIYAGAFDGRARMNDIDISRIPYLSNLSLQYQNFNKTLDFTKHKSLTWLQLSNCHLTGVTLGEHTMLSLININNNHNISEIDVSHCISLRFLECAGNAIESLDLTKNPSLKELKCGENLLTNLDLSNNKVLDYVKCHANKLTELDLSHNPELALLGCDDNFLTGLDLTANPKLSTLRCHKNQISTLAFDDNKEFKQFVCYDNRLYFDTMLDPNQFTSDKLAEYKWFSQQLVPLSATGNMIPVQRYLPVMFIGSRPCYTTFELYCLNNGAEALMTEGSDYTFDAEQGIITMLKSYADEDNGIKPVKVRFRNAAFGAAYTDSYDSAHDYIDSEWVTYTTESIEDVLKPLVRFTVTPGIAADAVIRLGTSRHLSSTLVRIDYDGTGGWEAATDGHDQAFLAADPEWIPAYDGEDMTILIPASADDQTETTVTIWGSENEVEKFYMQRTSYQSERKMVGITTEHSLISHLEVGWNAITDLRRVKANPATLTWLNLDNNKFTDAFNDDITAVYPAYQYYPK